MYINQIILQNATTHDMIFSYACRSISLLICFGYILDVVTVSCVAFQAMSSPEDKAYEIMRELDVSYVLVIFGGLTGYASDGKSLPTALQWDWYSL